MWSSESVFGRYYNEPILNKEEQNVQDVYTIYVISVSFGCFISERVKGMAEFWLRALKSLMFVVNTVSPEGKLSGWTKFIEVRPRFSIWGDGVEN